MADRLVQDAGAADQVTFDARNGSPGLIQQVLRIPSGARVEREAGGCDEVLFVVSGSGTLVLGGERHELDAHSGTQVRPGERYVLHGAGELTLVSVRVTDPVPSTTAPIRVSRLGDRESQAATASREFRIVSDPESGCASVTQFVGSIPPGRAPDHYHTYDEVIYVLEGHGVLHLEDRHDPIGPGSCIHLSPTLVHSLENAGTEPMQVLGVFRPAGSPAEAYYPDGTLAVPG
jgi:mannose-6-phosphate isomerase-like protein (cupin superfamily)